MVKLGLSNYWRNHEKGVFKIIESYEINGQIRFRVRIKGTKIIINVNARSPEEAITKARNLAVKLKIINEK